MSNELKDCPFCGSKPRLMDHRLSWSVLCECSASVIGERAEEPTEDDDNTDWDSIMKTAIDKWNKRTSITFSNTIDDIQHGDMFNLSGKIKQD